MYSMGAVPAVSYTDPWHLPLAERLRMLTAETTRVAYFYETPDNSTFRYRVHNMVEVIREGNAAVSASYFFLTDLDRLDQIADLADTLVICRSRYDQHINRLVAAFRRRRKKVLFDIDDFVFNTDYVHLLVKTLGLDVSNPQVWQDWFAYCARMGATLKLCDGAITTNEFLAARIFDFARIPVAIVPNFMNRAQLAVSERVFQAKRGQQPGQDGLAHLGYFSGSPSHNRDFAIVVPALEELLEEDPGLGVVVVGYIEAGPRLERFGARVKRFPFQDYLNLQRLIGSVEFNLIPLQFNAFTNSKSELKYFEAAAVGTLSIASPSQVYSRTIRHGENGYIAQAHQWASVIRQAVDRQANAQDMILRSRDEACLKYGQANQQPAILAALGLG